jgi:hypothetical protein
VKPQRIVVLIVAACLAVAAAGCSSDSDTTTSTTTAKQGVCAARKKLESSVTALGQSGTVTSDGAALKQGLGKVKKNLDALGSSVKADLKPQVDAVKSAVDDLQTAIAGIGDGSFTKNLQSLGTAIAKVGSTTGALTRSLNTDCPS